MSKIKFLFGKKAFDIVYEDIDKNKNVIKEFIKIIGEKDLLFLYKGKNILENKDILNKIKNNNILITVIKKNKAKNNIRNIICPECQE